MKKTIYAMITIVGISSLFSCVKECPPPDPIPTGLRDTTVIYQPGPTDGQDAFIATRTICTGANTANYGDFVEMPIVSWTYNAINCGNGVDRSLVKFLAMNTIPSNATIVSAKLSLYGVNASTFYPSGNSTYSGSPYNTSGANECSIKRITSIWDESTVTWATQPSTVVNNEATILPSYLQFNYNATDIDVTALVKDMRTAVNANNGFMISLKTEQYYRSMIFATCENPNTALRPKLVINYKY
jgi:hypothetical protein